MQETILARLEASRVGVLVSVYECAVLSNEVAIQEIHLHPLGKFFGWIEEIVKVESRCMLMKLHIEW